MPIPENKIKKGYTSGNEYVYVKSTNIYKGPFYKNLINGKFYAGKEFISNVEQKEIVPINKVSAFNDPNSLLYAVLTGIRQGAAKSKTNLPVRNRAAVLTSIQMANQQGFTDVVGINPDADIQSINDAHNAQVAASTPTTRTRYFYRQTISTNKEAAYKFGETDEEGYNNLKDKFQYKFALIEETTIPGQPPSLNADQLDKAEAQLPGMKEFATNNTSTVASPMVSTPSTPSPTPTPVAASSSTGTGGGASTSSGGGGGGGRMITTGAGSNLISGPPPNAYK